MFKKLELKKHALTAISYMLPLVVASGLLIAIGNLTGGGVIEDYSAPYTWSDALTSLGIMGMGLLPPFIAGYVSYSISKGIIKVGGTGRGDIHNDILRQYIELQSSGSPSDDFGVSALLDNFLSCRWFPV